ncbi:MAG: carbonic anhydrase, partial [Methylophilales bacterium 16-45-7]
KINALNVQYQIDSILRMSDIIADMVDAKQIGIVGGIYDLDTGRVNFLDNTMRI